MTRQKDKFIVRLDNHVIVGYDTQLNCCAKKVEEHSLKVPKINI